MATRAYPCGAQTGSVLHRANACRQRPRCIGLYLAAARVNKRPGSAQCPSPAKKLSSLPSKVISVLSRPRVADDRDGDRAYPCSTGTTSSIAYRASHTGAAAEAQSAAARQFASVERHHPFNLHRHRRLHRFKHSSLTSGAFLFHATPLPRSVILEHPGAIFKAR